MFNSRKNKRFYFKNFALNRDMFFPKEEIKVPPVAPVLPKYRLLPASPQRQSAGPPGTAPKKVTIVESIQHSESFAYKAELCKLIKDTNDVMKIAKKKSRVIDKTTKEKKKKYPKGTDASKSTKSKWKFVIVDETKEKKRRNVEEAERATKTAKRMKHKDKSKKKKNDKECECYPPMIVTKKGTVICSKVPKTKPPKPNTKQKKQKSKPEKPRPKPKLKKCFSCSKEGLRKKAKEENKSCYPCTKDKEARQHQQKITKTCLPCKEKDRLAKHKCLCNPNVGWDKTCCGKCKKREEGEQGEKEEEGVDYNVPTNLRKPIIKRTKCSRRLAKKLFGAEEICEKFIEEKKLRPTRMTQVDEVELVETPYMIQMPEESGGARYGKRQSKDIKLSRMLQYAAPFTRSTTFRDGKRRIDYVTVLADGEAKDPQELQIGFLIGLLKLGLQIEIERGVSERYNNCLFVKIHADDRFLMGLMDYWEVKKPFRDFHVNFVGIQGLKPSKFDVFRPRDEREWLKIVRAHYRPLTYLSTRDRSYIVHMTIQNARFGPRDKHYGFYRLLKNKIVLDGYALHDGPYRTEEDEKPNYCNLREILYLTWGNFFNIHRSQPLSLIQEYYGPKLGMYFALYQFYVFMLLCLSPLVPLMFVPIRLLVGRKYDVSGLKRFKYKRFCNNPNRIHIPMITCPTCTNLELCGLRNNDDFCNVYSYIRETVVPIMTNFSPVMSTWCLLFYFLWRRKHNYWCWLWELKVKPTRRLIPRPAYNVNYETAKRSETTGKWIFKLVNRHIFSLLISAPLAILTIWLVIYITGITFYYVILNTHNKSYVTRRIIQRGDFEAHKLRDYYALAFVLPFGYVILFILEQIYVRLSPYLTKMENHQFEDSYSRSLVYRLFAYSLTFSFPFLIYLFWLKGKYYEHPLVYWNATGIQIGAVTFRIYNLREFLYTRCQMDNQCVQEMLTAYKTVVPCFISLHRIRVFLRTPILFILLMWYAATSTVDAIWKLMKKIQMLKYDQFKERKPFKEDELSEEPKPSKEGETFKEGGPPKEIKEDILEEPKITGPGVCELLKSIPLCARQGKFHICESCQDKKFCDVQSKKKVAICKTKSGYDKNTQKRLQELKNYEIKKTDTCKLLPRFQTVEDEDVFQFRVCEKCGKRELCVSECEARLIGEDKTKIRSSNRGKSKVRVDVVDKIPKEERTIVEKQTKRKKSQDYESIDNTKDYESKDKSRNYKGINKVQDSKGKDTLEDSKGKDILQDSESKDKPQDSESKDKSQDSESIDESEDWENIKYKSQDYEIIDETKDLERKDCYIKDESQNSESINKPQDSEGKDTLQDSESKDKDTLQGSESKDKDTLQDSESKDKDTLQDSESKDKDTLQDSESKHKSQVCDCKDKSQDSESKDKPRDSENKDKSQVCECKDKSQDSESKDKPRDSENKDKSQVCECKDKSQDSESEEKSQEHPFVILSSQKKKPQDSESEDVERKPQKPEKKPKEISQEPGLLFKILAFLEFYDKDKHLPVWECECNLKKLREEDVSRWTNYLLSEMTLIMWFGTIAPYFIPLFFVWNTFVIRVTAQQLIKGYRRPMHPNTRGLPHVTKVIRMICLFAPVAHLVTNYRTFPISYGVIEIKEFDKDPVLRSWLASKQNETLRGYNVFYNAFDRHKHCLAIGSYDYKPYNLSGYKWPYTRLDMPDKKPDYRDYPLHNLRYSNAINNIEEQAIYSVIFFILTILLHLLLPAKSKFVGKQSEFEDYINLYKAREQSTIEDDNLETTYMYEEYNEAIGLTTIVDKVRPPCGYSYGNNRKT